MLGDIMTYEIQNHLGEVIMPSITEEEYLQLREVATSQGFNYYEHGPDLLEMLKKQETEEGVDMSGTRIFKKL